MARSGGADDSRRKARMTTEIILAHPVRTPIGSYNGALKDVPAAELGAVAIRETVRRAGLPAEVVGAVTMGNVIQAGNGMNPARQAAIHAEIGSAPGQERVC